MKSVHLSTLSNVLVAAEFAVVCLAVCTSSAIGAEGTRIRRDRTGVARAYYGSDGRRYSGSPENAARTFLREQNDFRGYETESTSLVTESVRHSPGGTHVRFTQEVGGFPLYRGDVVVSVNDRNEIGLVITNARKNVQLETRSASYLPGRAVELARTFLAARGSALAGSEKSSLVVYPTESGKYRLAYRVTMVLEDPAGDWEILLDAQNGTELHREDRYVNYRTDATYASASGTVFLLNPLSAARRFYGDPGFLNNDDAESDSLNRYRTPVTLDSLLYADGVYHLEGPACTITEIEYPLDPVSYTSSTPEGFQFTRGEWGFEAVMAYYHITEAYKRFTGLGFSLDGLRGLRVDPHGYQGKDNSHYSPSGNWLAFGTGGVQDAEDAEVIWHEYAHAIQYNIVPYWGGGETPALGEGYGDYWAASYARSIGQWRHADPQYQWIFGWDGHNPYWSGRMLNDTRTYPFPAGSIHVAGQIWASTLLSIREDLGRDVADRLVLKSQFYLGSEATAVDAAQALLQADRDLYGGEHLPTLTYWLGTVRKFLSVDDRFTILLVNDDPIALPSSGSQGGGPNAMETRHTLASVLPMLPVVDSISVQSTSFAALDVTSLASARVLVLTAGSNPRPFDDAEKRHAIVEFVRQGGKVLIEGGEVGSYYRPVPGGEEVDAEFRMSLLHVGAYLGNGDGCDLAAGNDREGFFSQPHRLPATIPFRALGSAGDRDRVVAALGDPSVVSIGRWSDGSVVGAIIAKNAPDLSVQSLYLPISLSAVSDTAVARSFLENALNYLLYHSSPAAAIDPGGEDLPEEFLLHQNYPNPFNPTTHIRFDLRSRSNVRLTIYNMLGQQVLSLVSETLPAGRHEAQWDGRSTDGTGLASGMYLMRLDVEAENGEKGSQVRSMLLLR